jgi:two-component system response regulator QseB
MVIDAPRGRASRFALSLAHHCGPLRVGSFAEGLLASFDCRGLSLKQRLSDSDRCLGQHHFTRAVRPVDVAKMSSLCAMLPMSKKRKANIMRLLLVEDDSMIAEPVLGAMRREGYAVDWARDGREAQLSLGNDVYDLVLLDLGLPKADGIDVLDAYRKAGGAAPVIILTARDAVDERVRGLDTGADDYLVKPFDLHELAARVRALLRRRTGQKHPIYTHGALALDPASHELTKDGMPLALLPREFALLRALIEMPTRVFTKAELEEKIYGWHQEIGSNAVEVHVHSLRRKIGADEIVTVRGVGYRLRRVE